jgi:prephenate dehydratase
MKKLLSRHTKIRLSERSFYVEKETEKGKSRRERKKGKPAGTDRGR